MMESTELCLLLPQAPYPGEAPPMVGGEMELKELEDNCESRSQIFLNPDGTVTLGLTDGPPAVAMCGLWQCGSTGFQMVIQREFETPQLHRYTVTRVYDGQVNPGSAGVNLIDGQMGFHEAAEDELAFAIGTLFDDDNMFGPSPIGFFALDGNTLDELELDELDTISVEPAQYL